MRLVLNASQVQQPLTGVGQYSYHLAQLLMADPDLDIQFFYGTEWTKNLIIKEQSLGTLRPWIRNNLPGAYQLRRNIHNYHLNKNAKLNSTFIYHELATLPLEFFGKTVVTVHDISWIRFPQTHPIRRVKALNRYFEKSISNANALITDSIFIKNELIREFGIYSEKINVIPLGVNSLYYPLDKNITEKCLDKYSIKYKNFYLTVGTLEPRKNLQLVLKAFKNLPLTIRQNYPLVIVGVKGWKTHLLENLINPLVEAGQVKVLGYLQENELHHLFASASVLVYPSFYEGFGLPPLEAMASGTPVICSNVSAIPEVTGQAAILIDPNDVDELNQKMQRIINDSELESEMIVKGILQASSFTWENCARQTSMVYKNL